MRCCCRPHRRSTPSSRCWPIRSSSTAGSAPTPTSSTCSICAALPCRPRCAPTACRPASRCSRRAGTMRCSPPSAAHSTPTPDCRSARLDLPQPPLAAIAPAPAADEIAIAVVGAHLSGMPLNGELKALGARLLEATSTAPDYRLYALAGSNPPKPGLLRVASGKGSADCRRNLGAARGRLRPLRRRRSLAAVDRHAAAGRRPDGEGLPGRGRCGRRRARYFELRRLARLSGAGQSPGGVDLVGFPHRHDMGTHGAAGTLALAAQDRLHHPVVLHVRARQPAQRAELRAAERLHARRVASVISAR